VQLFVIRPEYKAVTKPFSRETSYLKHRKARNRHCDSYDCSANKSQQKNTRFHWELDIYWNPQLLQETTNTAHLFQDTPAASSSEDPEAWC